MACFNVLRLWQAALGLQSLTSVASLAKLEDNVAMDFGTGGGLGLSNQGDVRIRWDATDLDVLALADDSVIKLGDGTTSFDLWVYGNTASDYLLWDASANSQFLAGDSKLVVGHTALIAVANGDGSTALTPQAQILGTTKADSSLLLGCWSATATSAIAPSITFFKSAHATLGSNTVVANGEVVGELIWSAADGTDNNSSLARIQGIVDAAPGAGDMPGRLVFSTSIDAGEVLTEALRIDNAQRLIQGAVAAQTISDGDGTTAMIAKKQIIGTSKATGSMLLASFSTTATSAAAPSLNLLKSANATAGSNTVVVSGEVLGEVNFFGADGTDFKSCAVSLRGICDNTPGAGDMPGRFSIFTSTDGAETPTERVRVTGAATTSTLAMGIAGATTGRVTLAGATSGVVTVTPNTVAGTWTMELPAAVGSAGQQLTDAAGNGVCSWAAASLGAWKNDLGILDPHEALKAVVKSPTHRFTYKQEVMPAGQWAPKDQMTGIFAEEAPWAMHGERDGIRSGIAFSPVNAFGYARAAIQALYEDLIETIKALPAEVRAALPARLNKLEAV